jgi:hypothetical protein
VKVNEWILQTAKTGHLGNTFCEQLMELLTLLEIIFTYLLMEVPVTTS